MTFLPIVERELRIASRKRATYWTRLTAALVAICISSLMIVNMQVLSPRTLSKSLFITLSVITFLYGLTGGARLTADCISEEKREGTLGLLFLTDLKGYDVVFGKLFATSLNAFYGILAIFPVLAISILLGGVTFGEFWRVMLVAVNLLFFSLAVGMFSSSICRDERKTLGLAFTLVVLICVVPVLIGLYLSATTHRNAMDVWPLLSPPSACYNAFDNPMRKWNPEHFWITSAITQLYGWLFLALACFIIPRSWQDKSTGPKGTALRNKIETVTQGNSDKRKLFRTRLLDISPFYWVAARDRLKPLYVWILLFAAAALWVWGAYKWNRDWFNPATYIFTAICLHAILKYWIGTEGCHRFVADRKSGAMELLLSTSLSVKEIIRGQRLALWRQFGTAAIFIALVDLILMFAGIKEMDRGESKSLWISVWCSGMVVFLMDLYALSWASLWTGISHPQSNRAAMAAISRILVIPWLVFGLSFSAIAFLGLMGISTGFIRKFDWDGKIVVFYWLALSVINNLIWISWSKRKLHEQFRVIATQRFAAPKPSIWKFWRKETRPDNLPPVLAP